MTNPLRVLIVEDRVADAELLVHELRRAGFDPDWHRVETEPAYLACLEQEFEVIVADYHMPQFDGLRALDLLQERNLDIPFIIVTATLGDETAARCLKQGATDYLLKDRVARLGPAVKRALEQGRLRNSQRRAEQALRDSEALYRSLVDTLPLSVFRKDLDGRFTFGNKRFCEALERPLDAIIGKTDADFFPGHFAQKSRQDDRRVIETGEVFKDTEEHQTPKGEKVYVEVWKAPVYDAQGKIIGTEGIFWDVTQRKRTEQARAQLATIVESSDDAIVGRGLNGIIQSWNAGAEKMYGYSAEEAVGRHISMLVPREHTPELLHIFEEIERGHSIRHLETVRVRKNGEPFHVSLTISPIRDAIGKVGGAASTSRDISERNRAKRRLATQYAVTRVLAESPTLVEALPQILQSICETAGWEVGAFWSVDEKSDLLRCVDIFHLPGVNVEEFEAHTRQRTFAAGVGLPGRIWSVGEPAWIPDVTKDSNFPRAPFALRVGLRGAFGFPIKRGTTISGVMEFFSHKVQQPDDHLLEMTAAIGRQIGQFTERKRAEEALRQAEEKYRGIFENALEGIFQSTPDGRFLTANPALARILGYATPEELITEVTDIERQVCADPGRHKHLLQMLQEHGLVRAFEVECYRKDGTRIWISANVQAVYDADGTLLYHEGVAEDITERKGAEEALRRAEEKYRGIFENAVDGIFQTTPDGRYLSLNPALARMLGYESPEELLASVTDIEQQLYVNPKLRGDFKRRMDESGVVQGIEIELYRKDRSRIWISENARAVRDADGRVLYYEGVAEDITERKQAAEALRQIEERFRATFEQAAVGIAHLSTDGKWLRVNQKLCDIVGYTREELAARTFHDITHPDDLDADLEYVHRVLADEISTYSMEKRYIRKDGSPIWINLTVSLVRTPSGDPSYFISIVEDITARKRTEEALQNSEQRLNLTLDAAQMGVWDLDLKADTAWRSLKHDEVFGYHSILPEWGYEIFLSHVIPEDRESVKQSFERALATGELSMECRIIREDDKSLRWIAVTGSAFRNEEGKTVRMLGVVLDVSERKRAGEQLRQALAELTESHEELKATQLRLIQAAKMDSIGRLAAGVAHEVKNPLAIAIMGLEYLSSSVHGKDPNVRMALKDVQKAINRADLVIRGLLDFSAPTKLDLKLEDLNPIVGRTLSLIRHELGKQHIKLAKRLAEDLPRLELDANKIEQVFVNICMNSVQAMTGGGTLSITTSLSREDARGPVVVAQVQDTGPGIPKNKLARVFDPFFTTKGQGKGTGLGLTVAKQIVELHGGTIHVNNRAEGGFRVSISFPTPRRKEHDEG